MGDSLTKDERFCIVCGAPNEFYRESCAVCGNRVVSAPYRDEIGRRYFAAGSDGLQAIPVRPIKP